jgi:hypothetical protein
MNTIRRTIAALLTLTLACVGVFLAGAPSQASHHRPVQQVVAGHKLCASRGTTNYYVHHWQRHWSTRS